MLTTRHNIFCLSMWRNVHVLLYIYDEDSCRWWRYTISCMYLISCILSVCVWQKLILLHLNYVLGQTNFQWRLDICCTLMVKSWKFLSVCTKFRVLGNLRLVWNLKFQTKSRFFYGERLEEFYQQAQNLFKKYFSVQECTTWHLRHENEWHWLLQCVLSST